MCISLKHSKNSLRCQCILDILDKNLLFDHLLIRIRYTFDILLRHRDTFFIITNKKYKGDILMNREDNFCIYFSKNKNKNIRVKCINFKKLNETHAPLFLLNWIHPYRERSFCFCFPFLRMVNFLFK